MFQPGSDSAQSMLLSGYAICRPHFMLFRWNNRRHWIEFPAFPNRDNSSWLAIHPFYDVGAIVLFS